MPGRHRVPRSARDQRYHDYRPAQIVGRAQRARTQPKQRRGTDLQAKLDKRKARSVCHACNGYGKDLVWTSKVAATLWSTMVDHNRLKIRWLDNILRLFRPSDMQVLWSSKIHLIRPPAECVHVQHHLSRGAKSQSLHRRWKFVFPFAVARSADSSSLTAFTRPMCSVLIRVLCSRHPRWKLAGSIDTSWTLSDPTGWATWGTDGASRFTVALYAKRDFSSTARRCGTCTNCGSTLYPSISRSGLRLTLLTLCHVLAFLVWSLSLLPGRYRWTTLCQRCSRLVLKLWNGSQSLACLSLLSCWTLSWNLSGQRGVFGCGLIWTRLC